jgi:hypothetical protein
VTGAKFSAYLMRASTSSFVAAQHVVADVSRLGVLSNALPEQFKEVRALSLSLLAGLSVGVTIKLHFAGSQDAAAHG